MTRYGCKFDLPHDLKLVFDGKNIKVEVCTVCNRKFRWAKRFKSRVDNVKYLEAHARNYAQKGGRTNRLFMKLYEHENCVIKL